jgi:hypothetical protein
MFVNCVGCIGSNERIIVSDELERVVLVDFEASSKHFSEGLKVLRKPIKEP